MAVAMPTECGFAPGMDRKFELILDDRSPPGQRDFVPVLAKAPGPIGFIQPLFT